jgi:hypothetical protein
MAGFDVIPEDGTQLEQIWNGDGTEMEQQWINTGSKVERPRFWTSIAAVVPLRKS